MPGAAGFIYPNELELQWSVLIVLYPFITGLVAGAFILASLERVFNVQAVKPTYRLALLTALAFLLVAPLPLQLHLGHPERSLEMYLTPHTQSAMAMFGFVYLWYLMVVLVLVLSAGGTLVGYLAPALGRRPDGSIDPGMLATIRTGVLAIAALLAAWVGRHARFREWDWLVYPLLVGIGVKMAAQDFMHSRPATLFVALALYGAALILAPRMRRRQA
jgi:Ni/Fe-hydrogenase subunit HybB-like protein